MIDVAATSPTDDFQRRLRRLIGELHAAPTATGVERVLLPGQREWNNHRRAQTQGIPCRPTFTKNCGKRPR